MNTAHGPADVAIVGGRAFVLEGAPPAQAVAVRSGRIAAVGPDAEIRALVGPRTRVIDAAGGSILPGFQDAHSHAPQAGLAMARCRLNDVEGVDAYLAAIREYAEGNPRAPWILGEGWGLDSFPGGLPHRSQIDAIVPDRPAYLENRDGHGAWVNSRALEMAGIGAGTPDPPAGRIERDESGAPTGMLQERAMDLVTKLIPSVSPEEWKEAILRAQGYLHSLGVTAWQDAHVEREHLDAYRALAEEGRLTARVVGALWWDRERGEEQVEELLELRARGNLGRLQCGSVKIMQDGIVENFTAALTAPYLDGDGEATDGAGMSFVEPEALDGVVSRLDREGFQVHFHAIGDRAVRECLDAVEAAAKSNGQTDGRHHIAHLQVIHPADVPRFAALRVTANLQPFWACLDGQMEHLNLPVLGSERSRWQYPFESLRRAGAVLAMGSDWPVSTPDPLLEMEVAVRRVPVDRRAAEPFLPDERLSLTDAIRAFTEGSAFVNHLERDTGSIEEAKLADLTVIDRDLLARETEPVGDARVVMTLAEGEVVYEDPSIA